MPPGPFPPRPRGAKRRGVRTVFFGTPAIAVPALRALAESTRVVGVVCQPDRPAGRGLALAEPEVKRAALELGLEVHQPVKVKTGTVDQWVREREADLGVVLAYGRILPGAVLRSARLGFVNLHASLLPAYRGAAPIQWALMRGETETGISLMQMDEGLDTGAVYSEKGIPIFPEDDAGTLSSRIAELAASVVRDDLPRVERGELTAIPQDETRATLAPPLTKEHGRIDWLRTSREIKNLTRGLNPRPGAFTTLAGKSLKVLQVEPSGAAPEGGKPGTVVRADKGGVFVATGDGAIELLMGQLEGKKALRGTDLVNGRTLKQGDELGS
jgi:methionyl-tRNA formyltransferase